jgi:hypothetical protein
MQFRARERLKDRHLENSEVDGSTILKFSLDR